MKYAFTAWPKILEEVLWHYRLGAVERAVVDIVISKTYGWDKEEAMISIRYIEKLTGIHRRSIQRAINNLIKKRVIIKEVKKIADLPEEERTLSRYTRYKVSFLKINRDYSSWENIEVHFPNLEERIKFWDNGHEENDVEKVEGWDI